SCSTVRRLTLAKTGSTVKVTRAELWAVDRAFQCGQLARDFPARLPGVRGRSIRSIGGARAAASACVMLLCFRAQDQPASPAITYWRTTAGNRAVSCCPESPD